MIFKEQDIDFLKLSDRQFEELCFDLLLRLGFKGLVWRQGGADSGRDIEGRLAVNNSLVGPYEEKWFFECKRYEKGVPPVVLNSKIAWADAEKPKHYVIFASSYLSNDARGWLEKISHDKQYAIHTIEGKQLKQILLVFPDVVSKHFIDDYMKLLIDARKRWLIHDLIPDLDTLSYLINNIDANKLEIDESAFLLCSAKHRMAEIDEWPDNSEPFNTDSLFRVVADKHNTTERIISLDDDLVYYNSMGSCADSVDSDSNPGLRYARLILNKSTNPRKALYSYVSYYRTQEGVEILIEATGDFPTRVRHITENVREDDLKSGEILYEVASRRQS